MSSNKPNFEAWFEEFFDRQHLAEMSADMRKNTKALFASVFNSAHFQRATVTHEELKVHKQLLESLIEKVDRLEKAVGSAPAAKKKRPAKKKQAAAKAKRP